VRVVKPVIDRILERIIIDANGCWLWTSGIDTGGYGRMSVGSRKDGSRTRVSAHRTSYEAFVGPILEGLTIDHLCRVRRCVNPDHLEPVTMRENLLRGNGWSGRHARKTHCINGHEFTPENINRVKRGGRECKACKRVWNRRQYMRRKLMGKN
jgi:hypothetical protein